MPEISLFHAVEGLTPRFHSLSDRDLEIPWTWGDYEEGIRFAFFRTYEQLRQLAADLIARRYQDGGQLTQPVTTAERALAVYHAAYRDLQVLLTGISDEGAQVPPAEGEWPLFTIIDHIVEAERGFLAVLAFTLRGIRAGDEQPWELSEETWVEFWTGDDYRAASESGRLSTLLEYYDRLHRRILSDLGGITAEEIGRPSIYWEKSPMAIQFRLGRFDSHLRQHTIQVEKALEALLGPPSEARRLLRLVYGALAEAEGAVLNAPETGLEQQEEVARQIAARGEEIARLLGERS